MLLTDDQDINQNDLQLRLGGNGDYYITIRFRDNDGYWQRQSVRVATSGGNAPLNVKIAVANLYRAMEEAKLNDE